MVCADLNFCPIKGADSEQGVFLSVLGILIVELSRTGPLATGVALLQCSN